MKNWTACIIASIVCKLLGLVAVRDFNEIWCESDKDIYSAIKQFEVE